MEFPMLLERHYLRRKAIWIKNADNLGTVYYIGCRRGKNMNMDIRRGGPQGPIVGKIDLLTKAKEDITITFGSDQCVSMTPPELYSCIGDLELPASLGTSQKFTWRAFGMNNGHLRLEDADGEVLASFKKSHRFLKRGTLTLVTPVISQEFTDQIFVSLVAMMEKQRIQRRQHANATPSPVFLANPGLSGGDVCSAGGNC